MIKSITVINPLGESLELELMRPEKSGFIVKSVDGLGPTNATINMTEIATIAGSTYSSARQNRRDIVMNLEFLDSPADGISIEDVRHKSYRYFPPQEKISLIIQTDRRTVETDGYVQANEPDIFSQNEGCAITIQCEDAYLYATVDMETSFSGVTPKFTFPFSGSLPDDPIVMGMLNTSVEENIIYDGDPKTGMLIEIHAVGPVKNIHIHNSTTNESMHIDTTKLAAMTGSGIIEGDTILLDTRDRYKTITLIREGDRRNILNCLNRGTDWLTLRKGDNIIEYRADDGVANLRFNITNKVPYLGV